MVQYLWLVPLGVVIGAFGTLVGAGGGFVLVPVLLLMYPQENPEIITSISLAVVFFNASSGSWAYARMGRVDYKSGLLFAAAAIPGTILGALSTSYVSRRLFDNVFGVLLLAASAFLLFSSQPTQKDGATHNASTTYGRRLKDKEGITYAYSYNPFVGAGLSCLVGFLSGFLGIGGGIMHVPLLARLLDFPVHVATATSHFCLAIIALTGTIVHIVTGAFAHGVRRAVFLSIGVVLGAQIGATLSTRVHSVWIIRCLALALGFVGIRIVMTAL